MLDLDADKKSALVCEDLVACIQDLNKEVESLRNLLLKVNEGEQVLLSSLKYLNFSLVEYKHFFLLLQQLPYSAV